MRCPLMLGRHRAAAQWNSLANAADWMDTHVRRVPDPELDRVIHPRSPKSFYSLGSGFVHGFKWLSD